MKKLNLHLYWESETLLSPISARIEMVVYEHKVFMTLVNILLSALRHWLSTTQGLHDKNFLGKPTCSFLLLQLFKSQTLFNGPTWLVVMVRGHTLITLARFCQFLTN